MQDVVFVIFLIEIKLRKSPDRQASGKSAVNITAVLIVARHFRYKPNKLFFEVPITHFDSMCDYMLAKMENV